VEIDSPHTGKVKDVGTPIKMSDVEQQTYSPPPLLGEHTEMILKDILGYSSEKIAGLRGKNIV
jgi:formyl-CoA transferase